MYLEQTSLGEGLHTLLLDCMSRARLYALLLGKRQVVGRGDGTIGSPHRAQISQFELFELVFFVKLDKRLPVEPCEAAAAQSAYPLPLK